MQKTAFEMLVGGCRKLSVIISYNLTLVVCEPCFLMKIPLRGL